MRLSGPFEAQTAASPAKFVVAKPSMRLTDDISSENFAVDSVAGRVAIGSGLGTSDDMLVITSSATQKPSEANIVLRTRASVAGNAVDTIRMRTLTSGPWLLRLTMAAFGTKTCASKAMGVLALEV